MIPVKLIVVEAIADAGEPDYGFLVLDTSTGWVYSGNGTATPELIYSVSNPPSVSLTITPVTTTYTVLLTDDVLECDGTFTLTLPNLDADIPKNFYIKNIGSGTITVDADGAHTIDGAASITLAANEATILRVNSALTGWMIVGEVSASGGGGGTTVNSGEATLSFGSTPTNEASATITGQGSILTTSKVKAWVMGASTADNNEGEHLFAGLSMNVVSSIPTAATGFTLYASTIAGYVTGDFKVKWEWI
jgi:hypothetical protein